MDEQRHRRDTSGRNRTDAITKATEVVERLAHGLPTDMCRAGGAELGHAHYLDPKRRPPRVEHWSERHRERYQQLSRLSTSNGSWTWPPRRQ